MIDNKNLFFEACRSGFKNGEKVMVKMLIIDYGVSDDIIEYYLSKNPDTIPNIRVWQQSRKEKTLISNSIEPGAINPINKKINKV